MTIVTPPRSRPEGEGPPDEPALLFPEARRRRRRRWAIAAAALALCGSGAGAGVALSGSGSGGGARRAGPPSHPDRPPPAADAAAASSGALAGGRWSTLPGPPLGPETRWDLAAMTGRYVIAWGSTGTCCGTAPAGSPEGSSAHGAAFDPAKDTWRSLPPAPVDVTVESTAWTGHQVLVWGSTTATGRRAVRDVLLDFDPATWRWRRLAVPPLAPRTGAEVLWSGTRLIVFGGTGPGPSVATFLSGATYDPRTNRWHELPAVPRYRLGNGSTQTPVGTTAAWDGGTLYVWVARQVSRPVGTDGVGISAQAQALRWRPGTSRWLPGPVPPKGVSAYRATAVSMDGAIGFLDGSGCLPEMSCPGRVTSPSALLDVKTGTWSSIPANAVLLHAGSFVWTGRRLVAVSPFLGGGGHPLGGYAAAFHPASGAWTDLPPLPVPAAPPTGPVLSGTLWTGARLIDSGLVLTPGHASPTTGTIGTSTLSSCPPITYPAQVGGRFCGPAPGPGNGNGVGGSCLGTETAPPCGPGMVAGKYYAYTLFTSCANDYVDGRWWRNELPGGSGPMDVWISVNATGSQAGWTGPNGAVGLAPSTTTGCS